MSGISTGSIFFTPAVMMLSFMNTMENIAKATGKCVFAGAIAVHKYNKKQEEKKLNIISDEMQKLDDSVRKNIFEQTDAFDSSIEQMMKEVSEVQKNITGDIESSDAEAFRRMLAQSQKNTLDCIERVHSQFKQNYNEAINRSNSEITSALTALKERVLSETGSLSDRIEDRDKRAHKRAEELLADAKELASSLDSEAGEKYIREAQSDIEKGNFQSAISLSSSAITELYMELYRSDAEEKEKNFYQSSCVYLLAEIKEMLSSLKESEFRPSEDSGNVMTVDLTQFMKCEYEEFMAEAKEAERYLSSEADIADSGELSRKTRELSDMFTRINEAVTDAFYLMTYSLNRVEVEKSIYSILKEKGFALTDTKYTDGDPSKAGERTYSCALTGEELTVSVIPYSDENNEIKTEIVLMSNESSEESREQYRKDIVSTLKNGCSQIESIGLKCREDTRNMNASETGEKTAIENPQHIRKVQG